MEFNYIAKYLLYEMELNNLCEKGYIEKEEIQKIINKNLTETGNDHLIDIVTI